ncbi:MAG: hypothetical protein F4Y72_10715 [Gammaproteobacteria bacterium]|nr:hypothetical protein [Gammaproteobacteria bacterium]
MPAVGSILACTVTGPGAGRFSVTGNRRFSSPSYALASATDTVRPEKSSLPPSLSRIAISTESGVPATTHPGSSPNDTLSVSSSASSSSDAFSVARPVRSPA